jgi:uncharacterized RDD family membrane protein YckC
MQTISVLTTQNVSIQLPVASIGDRILAYLLDRLILVAYIILLVVAIINLDLVNVWWIWIVFLAVPWLFYHLVFEIFMNGQSPGKRAMRIQVVRLDGTQPSVGDYIFRWIFSLIDFYFLSGALAVILIAANGKGQRLGDIVAGTSVVKLLAQKEITASEVFITAEDRYEPTFPQVTQLEGRDIELIHQALEASRNFGNHQPVLVVNDKIKSILAIQTDLPPDQFLHTLVKDYNHLTAR